MKKISIFFIAVCMLTAFSVKSAQRKNIKKNKNKATISKEDAYDTKISFVRNICGKKKGSLGQMVAEDCCCIATTLAVAYKLCIGSSE